MAVTMATHPGTNTYADLRKPKSTNGNILQTNKEKST
jgi:hypothetical protein